jgi:hypothetical protein
MIPRLELLSVVASPLFLLEACAVSAVFALSQVHPDFGLRKTNQ